VKVGQPKTDILTTETRHQPAFVTASHPLLLEVTTRLHTFSLLLPPYSDPAANTPRFLPNGGQYMNYLLVYSLLGCVCRAFGSGISRWYGSRSLAAELSLTCARSTDERWPLRG